jgi:hypothetical protein
MECLSNYSGLIIAAAAVASALFAGVIWWETRRYRQINEQLKELNRKSFDREQPCLMIAVPDLVQHSRSGPGKKVYFEIPLWITNLSDSPDALLHFLVKQEGSVARLYSDASLSNPLQMPLSEPINLSPRSSTVKYIFLEANLSPGQEVYPVYSFMVSYKGTDLVLKEVSISLQANYSENRFELRKT